jgi:hypothetical protein
MTFVQSPPPQPTGIPTGVVMEIPGLAAPTARVIGQDALDLARLRSPKLSGASTARLYVLAGTGYFGIGWRDDYVWYQEQGIRAFTMRSLAGKTIPMWIDDPTGIERQRNPRARTRVTASGKTQVLIFRKAAPIGSRKQIRGRFGTLIWVPRAYPGAPGRIARREAAAPETTPGRVGGAVARGNVGVRWRHPGLIGRGFLQQSLIDAIARHRIPPQTVFAVDDTYRRRRAA